ncbi:hypothetical protein D9M69_713840 [compost metagenome]
MGREPILKFFTSTFPFETYDTAPERLMLRGGVSCPKSWLMVKGFSDNTFPSVFRVKIRADVNSTPAKTVRLSVRARLP